MRLKRHYHHDTDAPRAAGERAPLRLDAQTGKPVLSHIEVRHTGTTPDQHFSVDLVAAGLGEGWLSIKEGILTLTAKPEPLRYKILRVPGKYPCASEPSGYEVIHHYDCVLNDEQHARYCAKTEQDRREAAYLLQGITPTRKAHVKEVARG